MESNSSSPVITILTPTPLLPNSTADRNVTEKPFSVFEGCDHQREAILFDLTLQSINVLVGIPANLLVIAILISNRKDPSTSDIYLGCLAFLDIYFGVMTPFSFVNFYYWHSKDMCCQSSGLFLIEDLMELLKLVLDQSLCLQCLILTVKHKFPLLLLFTVATESPHRLP
ncbi:unnamed protein product [Tetraodon nigroviridis]|uniref:(spotted green pufferfish) hypothetical protein n=1 Tax=Tetraodon nigroviridis TaxID=99883 RepID=Q4SE21_TETNG|nr:unnamed protein product [Tetraodon nigroviridis]